MKRFIQTSGIVLLLSMASTLLANEAFQVVVYKDSPLLSIEQDNLKPIFLKKIIKYKGETFNPVLLELEDKEMEAMCQSLFNLSLSQYKRYWAKQLFSGSTSPPRQFKDHKDFFAYFSIKPDAIGVVPKGLVLPAHVRSVTIVEN